MIVGSAVLFNIILIIQSDLNQPVAIDFYSQKNVTYTQWLFYY